MTTTGMKIDGKYARGRGRDVRGPETSADDAHATDHDDPSALHPLRGLGGDECGEAEPERERHDGQSALQWRVLDDPLE